MSKVKLLQAQKYYDTVHAEFLVQKLISSGINEKQMFIMAKILENLKTFALVAIPNLTHVKELKDRVQGILQDQQISTRRVIATLRPLADAFVEEEVLRHLSCQRTQKPELAEFILAMQKIKSSALEADPEIKKGNPVNVDGFSKERSAPVIYPL